MPKQRTQVEFIFVLFLIILILSLSKSRFYFSTFTQLIYIIFSNTSENINQTTYTHE